MLNVNVDAEEMLIYLTKQIESGVKLKDSQTILCAVIDPRNQKRITPTGMVDEAFNQTGI